MDITDLKTRLRRAGQEHVLAFWDTLAPSEQASFARQLEAFDWTQITELAESFVVKKVNFALPASIAPAKAYPNSPTPELAKTYAEATDLGRKLLAGGKVAAFMVAGGQGTRLGYDGPKGEYPVTPIHKKPLFQVFAEQILGWSRIVGRPVPWVIMTSEVNDARTREFFTKNKFFGLAPGDVIFFTQGMMPAFGFDGKVLLETKSSLALSPDGHGGSLSALARSGALDQLSKRGVEHLSYFQVDNPIVHVLDPLFIGLHAMTGSEMSSKTIPKAYPLEKVGNFAIGDGTLQVIEYSDLPEALAHQAAPDGSLLFNAGSIAIHCLSLSFVRRLNAGGRLHLPWHRAEKKVPCVDASGAAIKPASPNAVKLEQFVFDAIPLAKNPLVLTTRREEEFSPVKNATGSDSPETCSRDQVRRFARWLDAVGISVPRKGEEPDCTIEISPLYAPTQDALSKNKPQIAAIRPGQVVSID